MNDFKTEIDELNKSVGFILDLKDGPALHISNIALMAGGARILDTVNENGTPKLRLALSNFAENGGGADIIAEAIRTLFPGGGENLTDSEIGILADWIVEHYTP
jgi:hypothetical protein